MKLDPLEGMDFWIKIGDAIRGKGGCIECTDDYTVAVLALLIPICTALWALTSE